jgi:hypothetical protein
MTGETEEELDPAKRAVLLDLFSEIPILEHLMRNRLEPDYQGVFTAAEFGLLNYFCRMHRQEDRLSNIALNFEASEADIMITLETLVDRGFLAIEDETDPCVRLMPAGTAAHDNLVTTMAGEILEIVEGLDPEHLRITAATLKEIRRTAANLPPR